MDREVTPITQLMTPSVLSVTAGTVVREAAETLLEEGVGSLVVVDENDTPIGMFTNTDLAEIVAAAEAVDEAPVSRYMTHDVVTVGADASIREAAAQMLTHGVHHLPVTEDGELVGMLSTMDLAAHFSYTKGTDMV